MKYVKYNSDHSIWGVSTHSIPGYVAVNDDAVVMIDGVWYHAADAPIKTPEEIVAKHTAKRKAEICSELDALDAKGARAARAVALAVAKGEQASVADMEKLALIEEAAQALRAEMGAL